MSSAGFHLLCWVPGCCGFVPAMISDSCWKLVKVKAGSATPLSRAPGWSRCFVREQAGRYHLPFRGPSQQLSALNLPLPLSYPPVTRALSKGSESVTTAYWIDCFLDWQTQWNLPIYLSLIWKYTRIPNSLIFFRTENKTSNSQLSFITIAFSSSI